MNNYRKWLPYAVALISFAALAYLFTPQVFSGKVVNQSDIASWRGMANEIITYNEANPDADPALWTNSMFSGMPATTISVVYEGDYTDFFYKIIHNITGQRPPSYLLISLIGSFLLLLAFGVNPWLSAIGAIAMSFASYNMQIIQVGHNSKMVAIAFMPWVLAAVVYAYRRKALLGAILFAFALSFQIKANHPQITYYLAIMILGFGFAELYTAVKEKRFMKFLRVSVYLLVAGLLGIASNVNHLWPTYEYSKYTMRGGSDLAQERGKQQAGLDIAYATSWSYSPGETPNLFIPNYNGGSSAGELTTKSATYKALKDGGYQGAEQVIKQLPLYWGPQPYTAGPMYLGAVSVFLFILALMLIGGPIKWWAALVSLLAIMLSWGSNLLPVTEFFFNYIPMYNKFRTVSMVLVILQITVPLLAVLALDKVLVKREVDMKKFKSSMIVSLAITAGFALIIAIMPSLAGSFSSASADAQMPDLLKQTLAQDRMSLLSKDAFRSLAFILLSAAAVWFGFKWSSKEADKGKMNLVYGALALLVLADLWSVDKRYLNDSHFIQNREFEQQYALRPVDQMILEDKDPNYRVLDLSISTFNDAHVSYHHKTIGGYSPAKLQKYQDIIENHLIPEMQKIGKDIAGSTTLEQAQAKVDSAGNYPVLNMLNAKYIVVGGQNPPIINTRAMGNCWFVDSVAWTQGAVAEISALSTLDLSRTAAISREFEPLAGGIIAASQSVANNSETKSSGSDSTGTSISGDYIKQTSYSPNKLTYEYSASAEKIAVFSEIYYPAGWKATIDGQPADIFRANYTLRALKVPAGKHTIEFEFRPDSFVKGELYSRIASGTLLILLALGIGAEVLRRRKN